MTPPMCHKTRRGSRSQGQDSRLDTGLNDVTLTGELGRGRLLRPSGCSQMAATRRSPLVRAKVMERDGNNGANAETSSDLLGKGPLE